MNSIKIRRIYCSPSQTDGYRVLVDRLWPRGVKKEAADLDAWVRSVAPSAALRKSFAHEPERFGEFRESYRQELDVSKEAHEFAKSCQTILEASDVTLLYAAKDEVLNNASVLCEWIKQQTERGNYNG
jgi:uncharacterized protein YeaO (DUF488 family)